MADSKQDEKCITAIRCLSIDMIQKANSGHPGMPLGMAPVAHVLFSRIMKFASSNSNWPNRDRFVLSNGHGCALLYTMLHLCGFNISMADLKDFRQLGSITPGHPEAHETDGVEVSTGPLGQGIANAVGMAIAQAHSASRFNKPDHQILNHKVFVFCGDGCLQEGVASEAASLAGHLRLKDLILIYDDNRITIDGSTDMSFSEDVPARFRAYGWNTLEIADGNDVSRVETVIRSALDADRPTIISLKTIIGFGSPKADTAGAHGSPLGVENVRITKKAFNTNPDAHFDVPNDVRQYYEEASKRGTELEQNWQKKFADYKKAFPTEAAEFRRIFIDRSLPKNWKDSLPKYSVDSPSVATRVTSGEVLNALAKVIPELIGGSADLSPSNKTELKCSHDFQWNSPDGRYLRYGVREFGMAAIGNGLSAYGLIPFAATFLNFITYSWGAVRLGALSQARQIYIMTHDSICLGEDGPTHQPIEVLPLCRATPNLVAIRPADCNETVGAYIIALERSNGPTVLCLSRQNLPNLKASTPEAVAKGAYVVQQTVEDKPDLVLIASGSEVGLACDAAAELGQSSINVRVVSCPSHDLFLEQSTDYRRSVLPIGVPVISIEISSTFGWSGFAHHHIGMRSFGASAPAKDLLKKFGFTINDVVTRSKQFLQDSQSLASELKLHSSLGVLECQYDSI